MVTQQNRSIDIDQRLIVLLQKYDAFIGEHSIEFNTSIETRMNLLNEVLEYCEEKYTRKMIDIELLEKCRRCDEFHHKSSEGNASLKVHGIIPGTHNVYKDAAVRAIADSDIKGAASWEYLPAFFLYYAATGKELSGGNNIRLTDMELGYYRVGGLRETAYGDTCTLIVSAGVTECYSVLPSVS